MTKLTNLLRILFFSLLFSIGIPGALLFILDNILVGTGSGGAFDIPNVPQATLLLGFSLIALPFIIGTFIIGLPIVALMERFDLPILSDVLVPVRHGTLTITGNTATAGLIGLIVHIAIWVFIVHVAYRLKQRTQP